MHKMSKNGLIHVCKTLCELARNVSRKYVYKEMGLTSDFVLVLKIN